MPIDAINTAMTPAQFSSAMTRGRTVETSDASLSRQSNGAPEPRSAVPAKRARETALPPATLHFTYSPVPGKAAARRHPQGMGPSYWSRSIQTLG